MVGNGLKSYGFIGILHPRHLIENQKCLEFAHGEAVAPRWSHAPDPILEPMGGNSSNYTAHPLPIGTRWLSHEILKPDKFAFFEEGGILKTASGTVRP